MFERYTGTMLRDDLGIELQEINRLGFTDSMTRISMMNIIGYKMLERNFTSLDRDKQNYKTTRP